MTKTEQDWLTQKEDELRRALNQFGGVVMFWDNFHYLRIINNLRREIRRFKTQLGIKV